MEKNNAHSKLLNEIKNLEKQLSNISINNPQYQELEKKLEKKQKDEEVLLEGNNISNIINLFEKMKIKNNNNVKSKSKPKSKQRVKVKNITIKIKKSKNIPKTTIQTRRQKKFEESLMANEGENLTKLYQERRNKEINEARKLREKKGKNNNNNI